jgi:sigma-B regulation protein RsbU (phosphoserine phosphatase)
MVLYTDGITECHHHQTGEEFDLARLQRLVARHADKPAAEIVQTVFQAVTRYAAAPTPEDDQTLVVVKRPNPAA